VFGPALLLIVYWGAATTGLMRQCGHTLFLSVIVIASWSLASAPKAWQQRVVAAFLHPACFAWRGVEIALMDFGVTLLNRRSESADVFQWNDAISLTVAITCLTSAVILLARHSRNLMAAAPAIRPMSDKQ